VLFVVGVSEGLNEIIKSWNAPTVIRWTREFSIRADRIARNRINWKLFLQDDSVFPAIAEVIGIDKLGASLPQYFGKTYCALVFDRIHSHAPIFGVWLTEVSLASTELVHMSALPPHCGLNCIV
jgi:hypothetical protein